MKTSQFTKTLLLSLLAITLTAGCFKTETPVPYIDPQKYILSNDTLSPTLKRILEATQIEHDDTLDSVVQATQKVWLRKPGTERWHMENKFEPLRDQLTPLLNDLNLLKEIKPAQKTYDVAIILGAAVSRMRDRLAYALEQWRNGIRFNTLVFLAGERPLDPEKESVQQLYDRTSKHVRADWQEPNIAPTTETEMAKMVFDQADLPDGFKKSVKVVFIDTPMQPTADGGTRRSNTGDTIKLWLAETAPQGSVLAISNQPYVGYQHAVLKSFVPQQLHVETVGPKANSALSIDVHLDNLARWLYQENTLQKKRKK